MLRFFSFLATVLLLSGCGETISEERPSSVLMLGDSMLAWNREGGYGVSNALERMVGQEIVDRSVVGARFFHPLPVSGALGLSIPAQYAEGSWDIVILNGGGNDIWMGCGCGLCDRLLDRLIAEDGSSGRVVQFISGLTEQDIRVIFVGYIRSPGVTSIFEGCVDEGNEYERRIAALAARNEAVDFVSLVDMVPHGDRSYHFPDMVHPSRKGSSAIAKRIARFLE